VNERPVDREDPDRLYTITGGRSWDGERDPFDVVALIVAEQDPRPGMQSEHARILHLARNPVAVVELSADLRLPVSVVKVLLGDLLDTGSITVHRPAREAAGLPDLETLKEVLDGIRRL
jgi:hypothetical protein